MHKYDAVWILSSNHPDVKALTRTNLMRLEKALDIFNSGYVANVVLSGGSSDEMLNYLISKGIPEKRIYHEPFSRDTVGNVVFFELAIRRMNNLESIALVSSEVHLERVKAIINKLYPGNFKMDYFGVSCNGENSRAFEEHERLSLEKFREHFGDVSPGDDIEIITRLVDVHEEYKDKYDKEKLRAMLMRCL